MRILLVHNRYRERGGEDAAVAAERHLLEQRGHEVLVYEKDNGQVAAGKIAVTMDAIWSRGAVGDIRRLLRSAGVDVAHFHNTFFRISPAAYYACREAGVPVVQTLHNYRLVCPAATLNRAGKMCEACFGRRIPWPGVRYGCYRGSRAQTAVVAGMLAVHGLMRTWEKCVAVYVVLSNHARDTFIRAGLRRHRLMVKPNFVSPSPTPGDGSGEYALFVGRLSSEKGVKTLLTAWERIGRRMRLKIAGDGPLRDGVADVSRRIEDVEWLGPVPAEEILPLMGRAALVVVPSECYEGFPRVLAEAFAKGTPVIGSRIGAIQEIVDHGRTGRLFCPGEAEDLAAQVEWILDQRDVLPRMRREARAEFEAKYTAERNYEVLMQIYERARSVAA